MSLKLTATARSGWMTERHVPGLVSVIIPTFNRAHMIRDTLNSVAEQQYRPIEILVIDDGSTDGTEAIVRVWAAAQEANDCLIRYIAQPNQGAPVARNRGLAECRGALIQYLDSDDRLLPGKLDRQVHEIQTKQLDYVYAATEYVDGKGARKMVRRKKRVAGRPWIVGHMWHTSSPLFTRRLCQAVGPWNDSLAGCQEFEYAARVKAMEFRGAFIDEILDQAIVHTGPSISRPSGGKFRLAIETAAEQVIALLHEHTVEVKCEWNRMARNLTVNALRYARAGDSDGARRCLQRAASIARAPFRTPLRTLSCVGRGLPLPWLLEVTHRVSRIIRCRPM